MPVQKANRAQFYFFSAGLPPESFEVLNFSGVDRISGVYKFNVTLISQRADLSPDAVVNKAATLYLFRDGEYCPYSGIVSEFRFAGKSLDRATYVLTLVPKLWLLGLTVQTRIFQKKKVNAIVKEVLDGSGLSDYYSFQVDEGKFPELEYVVQYQESDLNFIARLMEAAGVWYFFNENPILAEELDGSCGAEKLVMSDKPSSFEFVATSPDVLYRSVSGMAEQIDADERESVHEFESLRRIVPKDVLLRDYNYRTPEINLSARKPVKNGDAGTVYEYGGHFKNTTEADRRAEIAANRFASRRLVYEGGGNCRGMRAGKRFTLTEHFLDSVNGKYLLTRVEHRGSHTRGGDSADVHTYANDFGCIPAAQADLFRPLPVAPVPRINGIMTASIEANGASYAALDDMGRYKVRMPFDVSNAKNYEGSRYMRLAQPYSGANYGMHFPSHEGVEMVWACVDGNPDRPLGLGTVPNADTVSPVSGSNKEQNVIRTAGGNEIVLDDTDEKQKVRLVSASQHTLEMDDEEKRVSVRTKDQNTLLLDDKNECASWNAKSHSITMTYKSGNEGIVITTAGGHVISIDDKNKKLTIQTKAGNVMEMDDEGKKVCLADAAGKNTVTLDGNGGKLLLDSQGEITISAAKDLSIKAANVKIESQGKIEQKATTDFTVAGMKISEKADMDVEVKGMNVKMEAQMNASLKGSMQASLSGMMAEVSGDVMAKVKGTMVMIN